MRCARISDQALLDDCCQEAIMSLLENYETICAEIDGGDNMETACFRSMSRAASRVVRKQRGKESYSLDSPLADDGDSTTTFGELVSYIDPGASPDIKCDAKHVVSLMKNLEPKEISILLAFADGVEVNDIASENNMTVLDAFGIRARAIEKIKSALRNKVSA